MEKEQLIGLLKLLKIIYVSDQKTMFDLIDFINVHKKEIKLEECKWSSSLKFGKPDIFNRRTWIGNSHEIEKYAHIRISFEIYNDKLFCYVETWCSLDKSDWKAKFYLPDDFVINLEQHVANRTEAHIDQQYTIYKNEQERKWKSKLRNKIYKELQNEK